MFFEGLIAMPPGFKKVGNLISCEFFRCIAQIPIFIKVFKEMHGTSVRVNQKPVSK